MSKIENFIKDLADPNSDEIFFSREAYEKARVGEEPAVIEAAMKLAKQKQEQAKKVAESAIYTKVDPNVFRR